MIDNDRKIIEQIEQQIGKELKLVPIEKIMNYMVRGYVLNEYGQLIGLNLDGLMGSEHLFLSEFVNLIYLSLKQNQLTDLTPLSSLTQLTKLHLTGNQITDLTPLRALTNLEELYLGGNQITDITPISALMKLETLYLNDNKITNLSPLNLLKHLQKFDVRKNSINILSAQFTTWWPELEMKWEEGFPNGLNLYGNPLTDPPVEIVKQGHKAVLNYFNEIETESVLFLESKLLLVGNGDVGKTTLIKKLKKKKFKVIPGKEDTTRGIDIRPWELTCTFPNGQSYLVKIHSWDFGGQDILHATHQFFLTKRSLYLFVWDPRKEDQTRSFDYWLNAVKLLGADSPIIIVMNKFDLRIKQIDEASFKDKFPSIEKFLQVSCVTGHHIPELTKTIQTTLARMPHLLDKLPKRWLDIRNRLNTMKEDYITLDRYLEVCWEFKMEEEKALFLSDYLHDLGIILHFRTDPVLADTVILKPEWATGAVYALIDSLEIQTNKGRFNRAHLNQYWDTRKYPVDKHTQLLRLMEKFELCFNNAESAEYIIPELLPASRPGIPADIFNAPNNLHLQYSYDFMPAGIVTRFISRIHHFIKDDHYWQSGVELQFSGSSALVVGDTAQKRIKVSVSGSDNPQLMGVIRSHFDRIHETLNMKKDEQVFEEVPCNCPQCIKTDKPHFFKYDVLRRLAEKGKDARCDISLDDIPIQNLLQGFLPIEKKETLFDAIISTVLQVQGLSRTLQPDENSRNSNISALLQARGYHVKDQTLWGIAASGKGMGELDIKIEDERGRTISIIEALNLNSLDTTYIDSHVAKLLDKYNCNGSDDLYILGYVSTKNFHSFCKKYNEHLHKINYEKYPLSKAITYIKTKFNKISIYRASHSCNMGEVVLHHILVEMPL